MKTLEEVNEQLQYIRDSYKVPAEYGRRVTFQKAPGIIVDVRNAYVGIMLDSEPDKISWCHPTWEIVYLDLQEPKKPKMSKRKMERKSRYQEYLSSDGIFEDFHHFLLYTENERRNGIIR